MSTVLRAFSAPSIERDLSRAFASRAVVEHRAILSIGRDPQLLASRAAVLRVSGRPVHSATPEQVHLLDGCARVSLVVLGHTLADSEVTHLAGYFRRTTPGVKLMLTCFDPRPFAICALFDGCVSSVDGPAALVHLVRRLLADNGSEPLLQA